MLPIPPKLIGTRRLSLLYPLLFYVLGTLLFCQLFLAIFVKTSKSRLEIEGSERLRGHQGSRVVRRSISSHGPARRSNSTEIRPRHQDLSRLLREEEKDVFYPWIEDAECSNYSVRFAEKLTFKPRALVSFPGSGNSWLRYLIESSTGIFTGSIFNDRSLYAAGLLGEMSPPNDGRTIVQKTHHDTTIGLFGPTNRLWHRRLRAYVKVTELVFGYRGILLIRNPYNALLSYWNFLKTKDHKGHPREPDFSKKQWRMFVRRGAEKWGSLIRAWLDSSMDLHIVVYEELQRDPAKELKRVLRYLDQPLDPARLQCVLNNLEGPFHRPPLDPGNSTTHDHDEGLFSSSLPLDLIVQQNIDKVNALFKMKNVPVRLDYNYSDPGAPATFYHHMETG